MQINTWRILPHTQRHAHPSMAFIAFINKKQRNPLFFPACVAWVKIIISKCLQEDNSNLKGLAFFSLHPRAYITSTQWAQNNILTRDYSFWNWTCSKAYACRAPLAIITFMLLHRDLKTSLESCIKTALEKYFQVACTVFSLSTRTKEAYSFPQQNKTHAHTQNESAQLFLTHCFSNQHDKKSLF